jgi:DNA repair exonuclease SbcCD ATPase subunit
MEIDELEKRISWLDSERQKDKKAITELSDLISSLREQNAKQVARIDSQDLELKSIKKVASRAEKVDADFAAYKTEVLKQIVESEKKITTIETKLEKQRKDDVDQLNKKMLEYQTDVKAVAELKKNMQLRVEEELRLNQKIEEVLKLQSDFKMADAELQRQQHALISDITLESKRVADIQVETGTIRKRIEEDRNITDLHKELIRKIDSRINDIQSTELERKQNQAVFIEKQTLLQVEKDNTWKEWQKRFADLEGLGADFNAQLLELGETHRSVKRSQEEFEEINDRFNRRINEITEMNRLSEERFRQEWVTFKADDQKRWTNYTLTREEEQREDERQITRILDRLVALEDLTQELSDTMQLVNEESQKQMRGLLNLTQEMLDSYVQSVGKRA